MIIVYIKSTRELSERTETYPSMQIILLSRSNSDPPGNKGRPRNNSATMQPNDHMSIAVLYLKNWLRYACNIDALTFSIFRMRKS